MLVLEALILGRKQLQWGSGVVSSNFVSIVQEKPSTQAEFKQVTTLIISQRLARQLKTNKILSIEHGETRAADEELQENVWSRQGAKGEGLEQSHGRRREQMKRMHEAMRSQRWLKELKSCRQRPQGMKRRWQPVGMVGDGLLGQNPLSKLEESLMAVQEQ